MASVLNTAIYLHPKSCLITQAYVKLIVGVEITYILQSVETEGSRRNIWKQTCSTLMFLLVVHEWGSC